MKSKIEELAEYYRQIHHPLMGWQITLSGFVFAALLAADVKTARRSPQSHRYSNAGRRKKGDSATLYNASDSKLGILPIAPATPVVNGRWCSTPSRSLGG
jgi:hypothetical protein